MQTIKIWTGGVTKEDEEASPSHSSSAHRSLTNDGVWIRPPSSGIVEIILVLRCWGIHVLVLMLAHSSLQFSRAHGHASGNDSTN